MPGKKVGRPHTAGITDSLLAAAERVMSEKGYTALTVDALVTEVGTTRPTFYRRFPNVAHVALEVIRRRFGTGTPVATGSLAQDLLAIQRDKIAMFTSPLMRKNILGLLEAARADPDLLGVYSSGFIAPRRRNIARAIDEAVTRGEIAPPGDEIEYVFDVLLGPVIARSLLPIGGALDDRLAQQTATTALMILGAPLPPAPAGRWTAVAHA